MVRGLEEKGCLRRKWKRFGEIRNGKKGFRGKEGKERKVKAK